MKILFYANCQFAGFHYFLSKTPLAKVLRPEISVVENYRLIKNRKPINKDVFAWADMLIYQPIHHRHGAYSTDRNISDSILHHTKPGCRTISFPYLYNPAFWCLVPPAHIDGYIGDYPGIDEYLNREVIDDLKKDGASLSDVLEVFDQGKMDFRYKERFEDAIGNLRSREQSTDIKVSDYILRNSRSRKLFLTQNHPTTSLFAECVNQLLQLLDIDKRISARDIDENISALPGRWPCSSYDLNYWKFEYPERFDGDSWYRKHIENIYTSTASAAVR